MKVVSYCEIPDELTENTWLEEHRCDSYVKYSLSSDPQFTKGELDIWLEKEYPELIDTTFLIEMDY